MPTETINQPHIDQAEQIIERIFSELKQQIKSKEISITIDYATWGKNSNTHNDYSWLKSSSGFKQQLIEKSSSIGDKIIPAYGWQFNQQNKVFFLIKYTKSNKRDAAGRTGSLKKEIFQLKINNSAQLQTKHQSQSLSKPQNQKIEPKTSYLLGFVFLIYLEQIKTSNNSQHSLSKEVLTYFSDQTNKDLKAKVNQALKNIKTTYKKQQLSQLISSVLNKSQNQDSTSGSYFNNQLLPESLFTLCILFANTFPRLSNIQFLTLDNNKINNNSNLTLDEYSYHWDQSHFQHWDLLPASSKILNSNLIKSSDINSNSNKNNYNKGITDKINNVLETIYDKKIEFKSDTNKMVNSSTSKIDPRYLSVNKSRDDKELSVSQQQIKNSDLYKKIEEFLIDRHQRILSIQLNDYKDSLEKIKKYSIDSYNLYEELIKSIEPLSDKIFTNDWNLDEVLFTDDMKKQWAIKKEYVYALILPLIVDSNLSNTDTNLLTDYQTSLKEKFEHLNPLYFVNLNEGLYREIVNEYFESDFYQKAENFYQEKMDQELDLYLLKNKSYPRH